MSGEPMWKKIATFDSSNYFIKNIVNSNIVTTDKGDKLFVGLSTTDDNSVLLQSNDLSNTSHISWTKSLSFKGSIGWKNSIAIDKSGSNIYITPSSYTLWYNNKSGHSKSWYKSTYITDSYRVATSSNGKIVYVNALKSGNLYVYSNNNSGKGSWTKSELPVIPVTTIAMSDKGDNIYIVDDKLINNIWRNNNNKGWTKAFNGNIYDMTTNGSGTKVYATDGNGMIYYNHKSGNGSWKVYTTDIKNTDQLTTTSSGKSVYAIDASKDGYIWENHKSGYKGDWVKSSFSSGSDYWWSITTNGSGSNVYASLKKNGGKSVEIYKRISPVTTIESLKISSTGIEIGYSKKTPIVDGNIHTAVETYILHKAKGIKSYGRIEAWDTSNVTDMFGLIGYTDDK